MPHGGAGEERIFGHEQAGVAEEGRLAPLQTLHECKHAWGQGLRLLCVYVSVAKIAWVSKIAPKTKRREKGADKRAGSTGKKKKR